MTTIKHKRVAYTTTNDCGRATVKLNMFHAGYDRSTVPLFGWVLFEMTGVLSPVGASEQKNPTITTDDFSILHAKQPPLMHPCINAITRLAGDVLLLSNSRLTMQVPVRHAHSMLALPRVAALAP